MDPDHSSVRHFVARTRALVDAAPPASRRETRTWIVDPLLETLGWDIRTETGTDVYRLQATIADAPLEYVLAIDRTPALFVAVDPFAESCSAERERGLRRAMGVTGVDRAIYTDGRTIVVLAGDGGMVGPGAAETVSIDRIDRFQCELAELTDAVDELAHVSRERLYNRLERRSRALAARRIAVERDCGDLPAAIVDELVDLAGDSYRPEIASATDRFLDGLVDAFRSSPNDSRGLEGEEFPASESSSAASPSASRDRSQSRSPSSPSSPTDPVASTSRSESERQPTSDPDDGGHPATTDPDAPDSNSASALDDSSSDDDGEEITWAEAEVAAETKTETSFEPKTNANTETKPREEPDGEYVVRFFGERGSIGAIGHSRPTDAMVHATEFLFDRGLSGIRVPWQPDFDLESDSNAGTENETPATLLNSEPVLADGTPMKRYERLSNGYHLNTGGTLAQRASRLEALAERAGLRVMLTGDWPSTRS